MGMYTSGNSGKINKKLTWLFVVYIFLSFFETYLTRFFGNATKYYLLLMLGIFVWQEKFIIRINKYSMFFLLCFFYKLFSVFWSGMNNNDFQMHILSQIGIVLFVVIITGQKIEYFFLQTVLQACLGISFLFGILSIIFKAPFRDAVFVARQVLTLFGRQNDPNNCAAFLLIGITLGLYGAMIEKKKIVINSVIVAVNAYALLLTSSRAGFLTFGIIVVTLAILPQLGKDISLKQLLQRLIFILVLGYIMVYIIQQYLPQANIDRLFIFSGYEGGSGRDIRWVRAIDLFREKPIFGWGWGGYSTGVGAIHNTFLTSLCDVGLIGTAFLTIPLLMIGVEAVKKRNLLVIIILMAGVIPAFVLDAINKRFFWNAIVISIMLVNYQKNNDEQMTVWENTWEEIDNGK